MLLLQNTTTLGRCAWKCWRCGNAPGMEGCSQCSWQWWKDSAVEGFFYLYFQAELLKAILPIATNVICRACNGPRVTINFQSPAAAGFGHNFNVTIRPDFTRTVRNFDGLSRENFKVSRDAELSGIPNPILVLFRFVCNVMSRVEKVYRPTYRPNTFHQVHSFELKMHQIRFRPGFIEELMTLPQKP